MWPERAHRRVARVARAARGGLAALAIAGCASSPNIVPVGPDTYRVTSHQTRGEYTAGWASAGEQKIKIYDDAMTFCRRQGKAAAMVGERLVDVGWGKLASVEVDFRCVVR
jgi:hypothetical protein